MPAIKGTTRAIRAEQTWEVMKATPTTRREILERLALGGAGAALLAGAPAAHASSRYASSSKKTIGFTLDVACRADTFRPMPVPDSTPPIDSPAYGAPFLVEGFVFTDGTIPQGEDGWDHTSVSAVGTWICRGWLIIRDERPSPQAVTTQQYHFEPIGDDVLAPPDQLVSEGVEGADESGWSVVRAVAGGTGRFSGARGEVIQQHIGTNISFAGPGGSLLEAGPNFRFEFHLL